MAGGSNKKIARGKPKKYEDVKRLRKEDVEETNMIEGESFVVVIRQKKQ